MQGNASAKGYMVMLCTMEELNCGVRGASQHARAALGLRAIFLFHVKHHGATYPEILGILVNFQV